MLQCKQRPLQQKLRKTRESPLSISEFERLEDTVHGPLVLVLKQPSECWLVTGSGLVELKMSRLFHTMELVDLADDAVAASSIAGVILYVLRFSDSEASRQASEVAGRRMPQPYRV
jgi:hypothetical protein